MSDENNVIEESKELVWFDTETVSIRTDINQIIQFAAIVTDEELNVKETHNIRVRLKKTVPIGVGACIVTGNNPLDLFSKEYMSEYDFSKFLDTLLENRVIAGYNSHGYDDKMVAQCLYQNLHMPYKHKYSTGGSLDVLTLVTTVSNIYTDDFKIPEANGKPTFRLGLWCDANGIKVDQSKTHDALYDVELTLEAVRKAKAVAPDIYESWMASRSSRHVQQRIMKSLFMDNINVYFGKMYSQRCMYIMSDDKSAFLFDLDYDPVEVFRYSSKQLLDSMINKSKTKYKPIRHIRVNKAPMILDNIHKHMDADSIKKYESRLLLVLNNPMILDKMKEVCDRYSDHIGAKYGNMKTDHIDSTETDVHISQRINEKFIEFDSNDENSMKKFHALTTWKERAEMIGEFEDERLQIIARNIIYDNDPSALSATERTDVHRQFVDFVTNPHSLCNVTDLSREYVETVAKYTHNETYVVNARIKKILVDYGVYLTRMLLP